MSAKREGEAVCDAAALREALIQCELFLGNVERHGHPTLNPGDKCIACDGVEELRSKVNAALSAPPRNCDVYATAEEAHFAFCAEPCEKPCGNCTVTNVEMAHDCFIKWLLAPATEQKGEGDGQ